METCLITRQIYNVDKCYWLKQLNVELEKYSSMNLTWKAEILCNTMQALCISLQSSEESEIESYSVKPFQIGCFS